MIDRPKLPAASEQLLVLWTMLLEGYVPVAHIVADVDAMEVMPPAKLDVARAREARTRAPIAYREAA
jgi:hypothetical protein